MHNIPLNIDNKATIWIAKDPTHFGKAKHIRIRYHVIRDYVKKVEISLKYIPRYSQIVDPLTKSLG